MFKDLRKIDYIIFGGLILLGVAIWKIMQNMNAQSTMILTLMDKVGLKPLLHNNDKRKFSSASSESDNTNEPNNNDEEQKIIDEMKEISDLIKKGEELTEEQIEFYQTYYDILAEDFKLKPLGSEKEEEGEKENNSDDKNSKDGEDNPKQKKSSVRVSSEHKEQIVMDDFKTHEMPKMVGEVASVLSLITNTNQPVGNTYNFLAKLLKDKKLLTYETKVKNKPRVYYGLPHWFEINGKKLKAEYLKKIKLN